YGGTSLLYSQNSGPLKAPREKGQLLVKFIPGLSIERIEKVADECGFEIIDQIKTLNIRVCRLKSGETIEGVLDKCKVHPDIEYAEPNFKVRALDNDKKEP
ncbi:MAG: hypothetical protein P9M03_09410, partial [Candidatus Theseobacter exili]|nr:hypothetical protein [Candidatus Theseobacter exili]